MKSHCVGVTGKDTPKPRDIQTSTTIKPQKEMVGVAIC